MSKLLNVITSAVWLNLDNTLYLVFSSLLSFQAYYYYINNEYMILQVLFQVKVFQMKTYIINIIVQQPWGQKQKYPQTRLW